MRLHRLLTLTLGVLFCAPTASAEEPPQFRTKWGAYGSANASFRGPAGIATDLRGNIYVVDAENHRIQKFLPDGSFAGTWGTEGIANGQFFGPTGVAVDTGGNIYVADQALDRIQKFDAAGRFLRSWGARGSAPGQFYSPAGIAADTSGNIYVTDQTLDQVLKFRSDGTRVTQWGSTGSAVGQLSSPWGIAVDESSNVYVADRNNHRVQKFSGNGSFRAQWGARGTADGQFIEPTGIAVDGKGHVYVVDQGNSRIQRFTRTGAFLARWGSLCSLAGGAGCSDPDTAGPLEPGDGQFNRPVGVAVDSAGNIYVSDQGNHRVQAFVGGGCSDLLVDFTAADTVGAAPLAVQFEDRSGAGADRWQWDFENDGVVDATEQNPRHTYALPGVYSVRLTTSRETCSGTRIRTHFIRALQTYRDTLTLGFAHLVAAQDTARLAVSFSGSDSLDIVSVHLDFDRDRLSFAGIEDHVPGASFAAEVAGNRVSLQWFDATGGLSPILPTADTLLVVRFLHTGPNQDSTQVSVVRGLTVFAGPSGEVLSDLLIRDGPPYGVVTSDTHATIAGRVTHYLSGGGVPGVALSVGPGVPDAVTDSSGAFRIGPCATGRHVLRPLKTGDAGGTNSLDAIKVMRHSAGIETFDRPMKSLAADVNGDGDINLLDAVGIVRAAVGLAALPSGDWKFAPDSLLFDPLDRDVAGRDFAAVRMGDVNGDWMPDAFPGASAAMRGPLPAAALAWTETAAHPERPGAAPPTLWLPDTSVAAGAGNLNVPVGVSAPEAIAAVSLRVTYADSVLAFTGFTEGIPGVNPTVHRVGSEVRIEWFDATGGASAIAPGETTLLTMTFAVAGTPGDSSILGFTRWSAAGDSTGARIGSAVFRNGRIRLSGSGMSPAGSPDASGRLDLLAPRPNPSSGPAVLSFELAHPGEATLELFDIHGRRVRTLLRGTQAAGLHAVPFDGRDAGGHRLNAGLYLIRLRVAETVRTRRMLVLP